MTKSIISTVIRELIRVFTATPPKSKEDTNEYNYKPLTFKEIEDLQLVHVTAKEGTEFSETVKALRKMRPLLSVQKAKKCILDLKFNEIPAKYK